MNTYLGLFLIAFSTLAFEVTLTRVLSVVTWYHLAFFAISTGMLGMTAGATRVYIRQQEFTRENRDNLVARACLHFALAVPAALVFLCLLPFSFYGSVMSPISFLMVAFACSLPFYFSGIAVAAVLAKYDLPIGRLYAVDLAGAALGCLFVLAGLEFMDAPSLILACSVGGLLSGIFFSRDSSMRRPRGLHPIAVAALVVFVFVNVKSPRGIRPVFVKNRFAPAMTSELDRWNSFSRVSVAPQQAQPPQYWGPSTLAPQEPILQSFIHIDGEASTTARRFHSREDIQHLRYDLTNIGWHLGRHGPACIIGVGGGRDVHAAILYGSEKIIGIDVNPIFIRLHENELRNLTRIAGRQDVQLVIDDARAYLAGTNERFDVIQMSLVDTWAATGAGAFSLSENGLYTAEAWRVFLQRLSEDGFLTVSRWHDPESLGETGRLLSLAVASLLDIGVADPAAHMALFTSDRVATLLVSRKPFDDTDVHRLARVSEELGFYVAHLSGRSSPDPLLEKILAARNRADLEAATAHPYFNYSPPTDESPYFFNMLRLSGLGKALSHRAGVVRGNLVATLTLLMLLLALVVVTLATVVLPLALRKKPESGADASKYFWAGALYFSFVGAGFMFLQIVLIQKLSLFLGHPTYALGIVLFTMIASTGLGSLLNERLPPLVWPWVLLYPAVMVAVIIIGKGVLEAMLPQMMTSPTPSKIAASIAIISPLGICLGQFFPAGMRVAKRANPTETPWYWALNGIFGVLCSAVAVVVSIYVGVSTNFWIAALCYGALFLCFPMLVAARPSLARRANHNSAATD